MVIRYRKAVAAVIVALGGLNLVLFLMLIGMGARTPYGTLIGGLAALLVGIQYFVRPYFRVVDGAIEVPALIGPLKRTYAFACPDQLQVRDGRLWLTAEGRTRKVPVARWLAQPQDWKALLDYLHVAQLD